MKLNTIHLVPAYLILAKELDDVIVHCLEGNFDWQGRWACKPFCQVILQETLDSPETLRKGFAGRHSVFSSQSICWLVENFRIQCPCRRVFRSCPSGISLPPWLWDCRNYQRSFCSRTSIQPGWCDGNRPTQSRCR